MNLTEAEEGTRVRAIALIVRAVALIRMGLGDEELAPAMHAALTELALQGEQALESGRVELADELTGRGKLAWARRLRKEGCSARPPKVPPLA